MEGSFEKIRRTLWTENVLDATSSLLKMGNLFNLLFI